MAQDTRIDRQEVEALAEELERELEAREVESDARPRSTWTDGYRASGSKHAMV